MSEKRIDDSRLEGISGAGGSTTPEEVDSDKPGAPPGIIPDPPTGGGNTGEGDEDASGGGQGNTTPSQG